MFGLYKIWVAPKNGINETLGWKQMGGDHHLYYNGTHWRISEKKIDIDTGSFGLSSNSDIRTFPPTNWTVWNFEKKWIPDDKVNPT